MNVRTFTDSLPSWLAVPMRAFEEEFTYPLGTGVRFRIDHGEDYQRFFRIDHGEDYQRFFRSMGEAVCVVAETDQKILGTISGSIQSLTLPDGATKRALYVGDLKVTESARGTRVMFALARSLQTWGQLRTDAAFAIVMDGTDVTPAEYTGRLGLPAFAPVAHVTVLRIAGGAEPEDSPGDAGVEERARGMRGAIVHLAGKPMLRSEREPRWLAVGDALGRLEDTRRAKRLVTAEGEVLDGAHLAALRYGSVDAAADLLARAARVAASWKNTALFTAVAASDAAVVQDGLAARLPGARVTAAGATVFATGLPVGVPWILNTSEI